MKLISFLFFSLFITFYASASEDSQQKKLIEQFEAYGKIIKVSTLGMAWNGCSRDALNNHDKKKEELRKIINTNKEKYLAYKNGQKSTRKKKRQSFHF
ncbi:hypothetical protein OAB57_03300 [Bacteriovoracaceae bacterium]|nr:hypothetical protein [Bacteriovoracaceae bacterium]